MADEHKETFFLDLDIAEFTEKGLKAKGIIEGIGDAENMEGLVEGLLKASAGLAAVGIVAYSLKTTLDLVFEGEKIEKTNKLFEKLAENVGLVADKLKGDLLKAADGLATENDLLNASNKALVEMGNNAKRLPEVMELAKKITKSFGGELIERFEQINYAIASGSTRMLRQNGIMIDVQKAVKDFAAAHGVAADMLTEEGRRQAILNAALDYGHKRLVDLDVDQKRAIVSAQQFKVELKEIGEMFVKAFEKIAGPTVRSVMELMTKAAHDAATTLKSVLGDGAVQTEAKIEILENRAKSFQKAIDQIVQGKGFFSWFTAGFGGAEYNLQKLKQGLQQTNDEIKRLKAEAGAGEKHEPGAPATAPGGGGGGKDIIDQRKLADEKARIANEILKLQEEHSKHRIEMADNEQELELARTERYRVMAMQHSQQLADVERLWQEKKITSHEQYTAMKEEIDKNYVDRIRQTQEQLNQEDERMEKLKLKRAQNTFDGIQRAAQVSAARSNRALHDFGAQGMKVMDTLHKRGSDAFQQMGKAAVDSSMSASEIMKGFFLNSLADIAQSYGELYMLAGIGGDYAKLAAGAALLALSGALRALAGSSGEGGGGSVGSFSGGEASVGGFSTSGADEGLASPSPAEAQKKSVTVQIMGHYFESDQTKTHLMDMLREVTDATDFKYQQIGGQ